MPRKIYEDRGLALQISPAPYQSTLISMPATTVANTRWKGPRFKPSRARNPEPWMRLAI